MPVQAEFTETEVFTYPENGKLPYADLSLASFWELSQVQRNQLLQTAIAATHAWHFARNRAYQQTVSARGVGPTVSQGEYPRLLRPTAQTFKSYIEILGTPFPQDCPHAFLEWLADQLSLELPRERFDQFRPRYSSMEALLSAIERIYADYGFEFSTSSGTSGRSTIMVRNRKTIERTVESFYLCFQRYLGMQAEHRAVFIMPRQTRIAMVRMASFSVSQVWDDPSRIHFAIPFPAMPDQVRIRAGQPYRPGFQGQVERRIYHPFMNWMNDHYVTGAALRKTLDLVTQTVERGEKLLLFGGWIHLHALALRLLEKQAKIRLAQGSVLGTGGGMKERYPFTPAQIRHDLAKVFGFSDGQPLMIHDDYGMAEGNWAAMQCIQGNYHLPPWLYAMTLDENSQLQSGPDTQGILAFFDPVCGGELFPAFFRTADQMRLVNGAGGYDPDLDCACGDRGAYICQDSIQRVDLIGEAGCAAQL